MSLHTITASSAYKIVSELTLFGRSFIYIKKNNGPNTLPCGTPVSTGRSGESCLPFMEVYCFLFVKYDVTRSRDISPSP